MPLTSRTNLEHMNIPKDLHYTKDHEWVRMEGDTAIIGITDFAQGELGDIVFIDINSEGEALEQEAVFGTVEAVKTVSDLFMPLAGIVIEVNPALNDDPSVVNKDPYGAGWMVKVKTDAALDGLMSASDYEALVG